MAKVNLTRLNAIALAGRWYVWFVKQHEANPSPAKYWKEFGDHLTWNVLYPDHGRPIRNAWIGQFFRHARSTRAARALPWRRGAFFEGHAPKWATVQVRKGPNARAAYN
ncbi:hypothetical protein HZZ13_23250 [Bradyrhizobium sp. CNPSo 4010]|uniref:Transposase n=1 Tax=Bradyrhizobium agreste TaxID=2751811 RepID=A0ABS0PU22_9BRAD|nr:hypothetical protein [Bradyrhizobium agreste]MBH5400688.1 hypothetical protein [Bradyrhizobium agreste]